MELCIENFTPTGNNLMFVNNFRAYQEEMCKSKSMNTLSNKVYYDRILNGLTDNRSIDILNQESLKNVKKLGTREYIVKYIQENRNTKSIPQMAQALAIAINVDYTQIYNTVVEEMKIIFQVTKDLLKAPKRIDISVDGKTVSIEANQQGVTASTSLLSIEGLPNRVRDNETGEFGVVYWEGDNQAASRQAPSGGLKNSGLTDAGDIRTNSPAQFSLPSNLPPPMTPVTFNREGVPSTNSLEVFATSSTTTREQLRRMDEPKLAEFYKTSQFLPEMDLGGPSMPKKDEGAMSAPRTQIMSPLEGFVRLPSNPDDVRKYIGDLGGPSSSKGN